MAATIVDIKKKTGLALATISKYLNGGNVLPENRVLIEKAIKDLNYEVNEFARGLVTNRSKTVGVIVFDIESMFNGTLIRHIGSELRKNGYGMLICDSSIDESIEAESLKFLLSKRVDGIIAVPVSKNIEFIKPARDANVPIVLIDRILRGGKADCVRINNKKSAKEAVNFLIENGHKKIAIICSEVEYTGIERYKGFLDAMNEAKIKVSGKFVKQGRHAMTFGYSAMKELLSQRGLPTAVFMTNYEISLGAILALKETDLRCPGDISLMGFDDLVMSQIIDPRMQTVVQPLEDMGKRAVKLLLKRMDEKEIGKPEEIVLKTTMREGNSVKNLLTNQ